MKLLSRLIIPSILASLCLLVAPATAPAQQPEARIRGGKHSHADDAAKAEQTTPTPKPNAIVKIKSTKSNASERVAVPTATPKANVRVSNRKQEVLYRDKATPTPTPKANAATTINNSKSNNLRAGGDKASPTPTPRAKEKRLKQLDARAQ